MSFLSVVYRLILGKLDKIFHILNIIKFVNYNIILQHMVQKATTIFIALTIAVVASISSILHPIDLNRSVFELQNLSMMGLGIFILGVWWFTYKHYFLPSREQTRIVKLLKELGYKVYEIPFEPMKIPILQRFKSAQRDTKDALYYQKQIYPKYDVIVLNFMSTIGICLLNAQLIKLFVSVQMLPHYKKIQIEGLREIIGKGIAWTEGEEWKRKRRVMTKVFNHDLIVHNIANMSKIVDNCLDMSEQVSQTGPNQYQFNVCDLGNYMFTSIMTKCFLGQQNIDELVEGQNFHIFVNRMLSDATRVATSISALLFGPLAYTLGLTAEFRDVKRRVNIFRAVISDRIQKRKILFKKTGPAVKITNLVEAMLQEQAKKTDDQQQYETYQMVGAFGGLITSGTDTTAHFLMMMVYSIARDSAIESRLRHDIAEIFHSEEDFTHQNLKKMVYVDWIQNQTIRCFGPAVGLFPREVLQDHMMNNIPIKKGTWITMTSFANHFNTKYFKEPHVFKPERWQIDCEGLIPYLFMGFGGGPRTCIGKQLALVDSKIALIKIFQRYKIIKNPDGTPVFRVNLMYEPYPYKNIFIK